jgi:diguanylate cyclase (GGDEF)-like protein
MSSNEPIRICMSAPGIRFADSLARDRERVATLVVGVVLALISVAAYCLGAREGPQSPAFVAVAVTIWTIADLTTTFLLLAQFYISGNVSLAILAVGYGVSGLLSIPHLLLFPGVFWTGEMPARQAQISVELWLLWHVTFPLAVITAVVAQKRTRLATTTTDRKMRAIGIATGAALATAGLMLTALLVAGERLPLVVWHGRFLHTEFVSPVVVGINLLACAALAHDWRRISRLNLCLLIALTTGLLDVLLNTNSLGRYSLEWYCGKINTLLSATVVLAMMIADLIRMFGGVAEMATRDPLTGLCNRRALDERMALVFALGRRQPASLAILVIDIDFFKIFNDRFGHPAGDAVLQRVAGVIKSAAKRPLDTTARWGGEEFVIILPGTSYAGALSIAEDVRFKVEQQPYVLANGQSTPITVSIGMYFTEDATSTDAQSAFATADRALYRAKETGRNRVVIDAGTRTPVGLPPVRS